MHSVSLCLHSISLCRSPQVCSNSCIPWQHIFITDKLSVYIVTFCLAREPGARLEAEDAGAELTQLQDVLLWLNTLHLQVLASACYVCDMLQLLARVF